MALRNGCAIESWFLWSCFIKSFGIGVSLKVHACSGFVGVVSFLVRWIFDVWSKYNQCNGHMINYETAHSLAKHNLVLLLWSDGFSTRLLCHFTFATSLSIFKKIILQYQNIPSFLFSSHLNPIIYHERTPTNQPTNGWIFDDLDRYRLRSCQAVARLVLLSHPTDLLEKLFSAFEVTRERCWLAWRFEGIPKTSLENRGMLIRFSGMKMVRFFSTCYFYFWLRQRNLLDRLLPEKMCLCSHQDGGIYIDIVYI